MSAITDAMRLALHNRAREVLGHPEGDTLMAHLPPVGWRDVATKDDVAVVANRIDVLSERIDQCATKADMERGFRRQTVWFASILFVQQGTFLYALDRVA